MTKTKRAAAAICAFAMLFGGGLLPEGSLPIAMPFAINASAASYVDWVRVNGIEYYLYDDNTATLVAMATWGTANLTIPETVEYKDKSYTVTSIDRDFEDQPYIVNLTIPSGVTSISKNAFSRCSALGNVYIPDNGLDVSQTGIRAAANKIYYKKNSTGGITVTSITPRTGVSTVDIPATIGSVTVSEIFFPIA